MAIAAARELLGERLKVLPIMSTNKRLGRKAAVEISDYNCVCDPGLNKDSVLEGDSA